LPLCGCAGAVLQALQVLQLPLLLLLGGGDGGARRLR
jgi:hypothetical protein